MPTELSELSEKFSIPDWRCSLRYAKETKGNVEWDLQLPTFSFLLGDKIISREVVRALQSEGWLLHCQISPVIGAVVSVTPIVYTDSPGHCFHVSPLENWESIRRRGLLSGQVANCSTTGRSDAGWYVHATLTEKDAENWASERLLGMSKPIGEWVCICVQLFDLKLIRDPKSRQTGFIIDAEYVPATSLTRIRTFEG